MQILSSPRTLQAWKRFVGFFVGARGKPKTQRFGKVYGIIKH